MCSYSSFSETGRCWSLFSVKFSSDTNTVWYVLPYQIKLFREFLWKAPNLMQLVIQIKAKIIIELEQMFGIRKNHGFETKSKVTQMFWEEQVKVIGFAFLGISAKMKTKHRFENSGFCLDFVAFYIFFLLTVVKGQITNTSIPFRPISSV